ncbi:MAG: hypothetical protein SVU32_04190, partial [Candidatus Nanohaloarchaea archaeon]|nr:hypothetical protein [Candidatus Nanohaloarchaea archaeon]
GFFDWLATLLQEAPEDDTGGGGTGGGFGGGGTTEPEPVLVPGLRLLSDPVTLRLRAGERGSFTVRFRNNGTGNGTYNLAVQEIQRLVTPDQASYLVQPNETRESRFQVTVLENVSSGVYRGAVTVETAGRNVSVPVDIVVPTPRRQERLEV